MEIDPETGKIRLKPPDFPAVVLTALLLGTLIIGLVQIFGGP